MSLNRNRLFRFSIRSRIFLGFGLLSFLMISIGLLSLWGLSRFYDHFNSYLSLARESDALIDVDNSTKDIQRQVVRFMYQGYQSAGASALQDMTELEERIEIAISGADVESRRYQTLVQIQSRLDRYRNSFESAIVERRVQTELVEVELPRILASLEEYVIDFSDTPDALHSPSRAIILLGRISENIRAYFSRYDYQYIEEAYRSLEQLRKEVAGHVQNGGRTPPEHVLQINACLEDLERVTRRAVQATRSYLFLINVVMSGEAAEMLYLTETLGESGRAREVRERQALGELIGSTSLAIVLLVVGAVLLGLIYAVATTRSIDRPLTAITRTFRALSDGKRVDHIPEMERHDEIGELAHSADIFRQRNEETERLLKRADQLTAELREKTRELEQSNLEMEQFVYTVSHDLKSPIVTSMGFIGMVRDLAEAGQYEEAYARLDRVEAANQRMGILINDLLELSRVGRTDDPIEHIDMNRLFEQLEEAMLPAFEKAGFQLELKGPFPVIEANQSRIMQVFENLLTNALKYGKAENEATGRVIIRVEEDSRHDRYVFKVRDFGPGIADEFKEKIFNLFSHLHKGEGTGIGLCIVRKLTRLYAGEAWVVDPADGPGAEFCIALPATRHENPHTPTVI